MTEDRTRLHAWLMICVWLILAPCMIALAFVRRKMLLLQNAAGAETKADLEDVDARSAGVAGRLMLAHKVGQFVTVVVASYAITLPFQHDHGDGHHRRLSPGHAHGHSHPGATSTAAHGTTTSADDGHAHHGPSLHAVLGFTVLILAVGQLLLWLGKKYYLYTLESKTAATSKTNQGVQLSNVADAEGEVRADAAGSTAKSSSSAQTPPASSFNRKWLLVHRTSGLLCGLVAVLNCITGSFKFENHFDDGSFSPIVAALAAFAVCLVAGSWVCGDRIAKMLM